MIKTEGTEDASAVKSDRRNTLSVVELCGINQEVHNVENDIQARSVFKMNRRQGCARRLLQCT